MVKEENKRLRKVDRLGWLYCVGPEDSEEDCVPKEGPSSIPVNKATGNAVVTEAQEPGSAL